MKICRDCREGFEPEYPQVVRCKDCRKKAYTCPRCGGPKKINCRICRSCLVVSVKTCVDCGQEFKPGADTEKWCSTCRKRLDICPKCGGPKRRQAKQCQDCFTGWLNREFHARPEVIVAMHVGRSERARVNLVPVARNASEETRQKMSVAQCQRFERDGPTLGAFKPGHEMHQDQEYRAAWVEAMAEQRQSKGPTKVERTVSQWLTELGVVWEREKPLDNLALDLWLPEYQAAIEVMSEYWHDSVAQQERDARKRDLLDQAGIPLLELWYEEIRRGEAQQQLRDWLESLR